MFMTANGLVSVEDHLVDLFDKADVSTIGFWEMNKCQAEYRSRNEELQQQK